MMNSFSRREMLKDKRAFQRVYRQGSSYANHFLVLYVARGAEGKGLVGFAAGKKLGCAVVRNRVKRLLREAWRHHRRELDSSASLILVGRAPLVEASAQDAERAFIALGKKAGIFKKDAHPVRLVGAAPVTKGAGAATGKGAAAQAKAGD